MAMFFRFFPSVFCLEMKIEMRLRRVAWNDKNTEKGEKMSVPLLRITNVIG